MRLSELINEVTPTTRAVHRCLDKKEHKEQGGQ